MKRIFSILSVLFALSIANLSARGIDPVADSVSRAKISAYFENIRQTKHRPSVVLVLSGGGAKGAAHIGIVRRLEELNIPVDMVMGTSMGGLFGGLFAMGYNSYEMEDIVTTIDWNTMMFDRFPREFTSLEELNFKSRHQLTIPFYYQKEKFIQMKENDYSSGREKYEPLALQENKAMSKKLFKDNIWESIPSGVVYGQNVTNLIGSLSAGYQDEMDFMNLPKPFVCVATDLVSFQGKYWFDGCINTALRSTMSIPGLFAPVKIDGMVLTDGGMRDNYPTAFARSLGADIIIGMELSDRNKNYQEVNNVADVASQIIDLLIADNFARNKDVADLKLKPDMHEFNMLSFSKENIRTIIDRGYATACAADSTLLAIKQRVGADSLVFQGPHAVDLRKNKVKFDEIVISGVTEKEAKYLRKKIKLSTDAPLGKDEIDRAVTTIYATQAFDYVTYKIYGSSEPFVLDIQCKRGPVCQVGVGLRVDTEEVISLLADIGIGARKLQGPKADFTARISANPMAKLRLYYDTPHFPTINLTASGQFFGNFYRTLGPDYDASAFSCETSPMKYWYVNSELYFSGIKWKMFDFKIGSRYDFFNIKTIGDVAQFRGNYNFSQRYQDYLHAFVDIHTQTFDKNYFPDHGLDISLYGSFNYATPHLTEYNPFGVVAFSGKFVIPAKKVFAFIPSVDLRAAIGNDIPMSYANFMGGTIPGRYAPQQVTFCGLNKAAAMGNYLAVFRTDFRFQIGKNNYITASANYVKDGDSFKNWFHYDKNDWGIYGVALEYAYNTIVGPIKANLHYSNFTNSLGFYVGIGLDF